MCWQKNQPLEKEKKFECSAPICEYSRESHPGYFYVGSASSLSFRLNCAILFSLQNKCAFKLLTFPTT